jgi:hypothetical protein
MFQWRLPASLGSFTIQKNFSIAWVFGISDTSAVEVRAFFFITVLHSFEIEFFIVSHPSDEEGNGLFEDVLKSELTKEQFEEQFLQFVSKHCVKGVCSYPILIMNDSIFYLRNSL